MFIDAYVCIHILYCTGAAYVLTTILTAQGPLMGSEYTALAVQEPLLARECKVFTAQEPPMAGEHAVPNRTGAAQTCICRSQTPAVAGESRSKVLEVFEETLQGISSNNHFKTVQRK